MKLSKFQTYLRGESDETLLTMFVSCVVSDTSNDVEQWSPNTEQIRAEILRRMKEHKS